jgi:hypothetical protein
MMITSEKATQKSITFPLLSVHHTSFLWALCHELVLSTTHRLVTPSGAGSPFREISAVSPRSSRRSRVIHESIAAVEVYPHISHRTITEKVAQ